MDERSRSAVERIDEALKSGEKVYDDVLETLGDTPLVKLNSVASGIDATVLAKLEFFNPGGSVKDRIGLSMIEDAEKSGELKPGGTIVEATSGNTGVGLAIAAAIKGYKAVFVMPDKMSDEKVRLLRAFGARVVITPTAVAPDDPQSYYSVSEKIASETPNSFYASQYHNPANPDIHYRTTGPEIWERTGGKVDVFVAGMGTGGTITGVGRFLKEKRSETKIVGVDPVGSVFYEYFKTGRVGEAHTYKVEGIGEDMLPTALDFDVVDDVVQVTDKESFLMTRRLVREEGIFCGGSGGSAVVGALRYAQDLPADHTAVVVIPDSGSRYLSKVFDDDWMRENRYLEAEWGGGQVGSLLRSKAMQEVITAHPSDRQADVIGVMKEHNISQLPVVEGNYLVGIITEVDLLNHMLSGEHEHDPDETIAPIVSEDVPVVGSDTSLDVLAQIFSHDDVAVVLEDGEVTGIITKIDVIDFLSDRVA